MFYIQASLQHQPTEGLIWAFTQEGADWTSQLAAILISAPGCIDRRFPTMSSAQNVFRDYDSLKSFLDTNADFLAKFYEASRVYYAAMPDAEGNPYAVEISYTDTEGVQQTIPVTNMADPASYKVLA
jgi:hypothetical protein